MIARDNAIGRDEVRGDRESHDRRVLSLDRNHPTPEIRARAFVFSDPRSRALVPLIERVAPSDASILIRGETGTGKELVARFIHERSARADRPFVAVNCGAFSESLIESELFGHEKGAFTGAASTRAGWFEAANGGTLFLDEVGDLPMSLQVKLLRVLQEREVTRIGARSAIPLDLRLIAATNVDLPRAVAAGRFREDLFFRLEVISIPLLPLRERRADILPLARHFLEIYGAKIRAKHLDLSAAAEEALFSYAWPGNIRELENAIHRATLTCLGGVIEPTDLALHTSDVLGASPHAAAPAAAAPPTASGEVTLESQLLPLIGRFLEEQQSDLLDRTLAHVIRTAFDRNEGNQLRTAAALGVTRNVLRTHLKNLKLI
jgi:DNA-binding NtrC family response regulator